MRSPRIPLDDQAVETDALSGAGEGKVRSTRRYWIAGIACLLLIGGVGSYAVYASSPAPAADSPAPPVDTVAVEKGTLTGNRSVPGVLDFAQTRDLASELSGVLTGTPQPGSTVEPGGELFSVDNQGIYLFSGTVPAWRAFESGMSDGPDVQQLESTLQAAGYFDPAPNTKFTWDTVEAIYEWQEATGQPKTGRIELGRIVFSPSSVRVADLVAAVGDRVGPGMPVIKTSALEQVVTADLKLADQKLAVVGAVVAVQLPGGVSTTGKITGVGQPTEREKNGSTTVVIPLTISLDTTEDTQGIQKANVKVDVPSEIREEVLSVPLEALLALPGGSFGVEIVDSDGATTQVPVTTGLFAGGRVEISGDRIKAGVEVVVPGS